MSDTAKAYAINASEGVSVHIDDSSEDEQFHLSVRAADGSEVESHPGLTADTVGAVASEHFSVEYVDPPAPDTAEEEE